MTPINVQLVILTGAIFCSSIKLETFIVLPRMRKMEHFWFPYIINSGINPYLIIVSIYSTKFHFNQAQLFCYYRLTRGNGFLYRLIQTDWHQHLPAYMVVVE